MPIVYVLWVAVLLAVVAGALMPTGKTAYHQAHNAIGEAKTAAVAEAAFNRAALALLQPRAEARWQVNGIPQNFTFEGTVMNVAIQDETGRIDLNQADEPLLSGLFRSVGLSAVSVSGLVDKVLDWRNTKPTRRLNGATDADYRAAGRDSVPRNGPFQSIDELKLVLGVTPELFKQIEPAITVYSGRPFINPQVAPPQALRALPGMSADVVATQIAARMQADNVQSYGTTSATDVTNPLNSLAGRAFTISVDVIRPEGVVSRQATIRITDNPSKPYWTLDWKNP